MELLPDQLITGTSWIPCTQKEQGGGLSWESIHRMALWLPKKLVLFESAGR